MVHPKIKEVKKISVVISNHLNQTTQEHGLWKEPQDNDELL